MKFTVNIKDPDVFADAIQEAVTAEVAALGLAEDEAEGVIERRTEKVGAALERWVEYGEYIRVEFDTEAGTATVVPRKR